jgi:hypothetical protein
MNERSRFRTAGPIARAAMLAAALVLGAAFRASALDSSPGETRIALVIGNGSYANAPLKNPANDARDLSEALKGLGFSVTLVLDADLSAMSRAIRDFGNAIKRPDAVALFYYSGHGVQYRGANYLIPAKADIQDPDELAFSAVNADQVYAKMESAGDKTNIVILDACRNNPFPGTERSGDRGLAIVGSAPPQSLVVYATAPGKTAQDGQGRNGTFTAALLKHLGEPNLDIELMIRKVRADVIESSGGAQVPWHNSSISGSGFAFARREEKESAAKAPAAKIAPAASAASPRVAAGAATGILTLTSEPAGIRVEVDGGQAYATPFSLELEPGAHSFQPQQTVIDYKHFAGQSLQWINVAAGDEIKVPLRIKPETAMLRFKRIPPGYEVFVDGERVGETPLGAGGEIEVPAGVLKVRFEKPGEPARTVETGVPPGETGSVSWGGAKDSAYPLQRASIKLDGKADTWYGIEPVYETDEPKPFMGDASSGIRRVYLCRDEKYLYWRVDFDGNDPLMKRPKGAGKAVNLQFDIWNNDARRNLSFGSQYDADMGAIRYYCGIWDDKTKTYKEFPSVENAGKHVKDMFAGRVEWKWFWDGVPPVEIPRLTLVNSDANWRWIESSKILLEMGWIDFFGAP